VNGVYWIYADASLPLAPVLTPPATRGPIPLAIVLCPRGGRTLHRELAELRSAGIQTLVSLLDEEQIAMFDMVDEGPLAKRLGMQFLSHPIPDHNLPPDARAFREFVTDLARRLHTGERIGIHCWGSIGRATVTAACTLIHLGWEPAVALAAVEEARGCPVPDTEEQERWILNYQAQP
jgi:protein-tyrosine phosphatase